MAVAAGSSMAKPGKKDKGCDISKLQLVLPPNPANSTGLAPPPNPATAVLLGVGYQNYTCSAQGKYTAVGAVADLFDLSCLSKNKKDFAEVEDKAYNQWISTRQAKFNPKDCGGSAPPFVGYHFFQPTAAGGIAPVWDLRTYMRNPDAYVVGARVAGVPAPDGNGKNVDWLELKGVEGSLAGPIYRTETRGGVAPAACSPGVSLPFQVKYTTKYFNPTRKTVNTYLYGIVTYQYFAYFNTQFNDPLWVKATVCALFVIDSVHSASIQNYGRPEALLVAVWTYGFTVFITALVALFTQVFLSYRILRMTRSVYVYAMTLGLAIVSFGLGIACTTKTWLVKTVFEFPEINAFLAAWLSMQVAVDAIICGILVYHLTQSRTGFERSDTAINRLMRTSIQTVFFVAQPNTQMYCFFGLPISRLYTNTLMDTLLCREYLRDLFKQRETVGTFLFAHFGRNVDLLQNEQFRTTATTGDVKLHVIPQDMTDMKFDNVNLNAIADEPECQCQCKRHSSELGSATRDYTSKSRKTSEQKDPLHDEDPC
ncbi:hypothetical protein CVT24_005831 [Panaeolus cyanescens]|uniref:DUF6534 domain-containing protein n=1 Tax=Panaeolus cyanescens TaxID=181874 RepID=A0A409VDL0_9AGAR|nr:hypothetical protein CVT24_005831 [Panaeolus cyanescens]